ncbi:MAG: hypothetical protein FJY74_08850 [Candidatus Eisenbacteria bacterium]|nr:hypothetical protein [Candidatus Eisenbacteria bacterium]
MSVKTLIAFVTAGGATERYAQVVAETLRSAGHDVEVVDLKRAKVADLSGYDGVVLGAGVRMGMVYRKAKAFLARKDLKGTHLAVFLSSGIAIEDPEKARAKFLTPLMTRHGLEPVACDAFPGRMPGSAGKANDRTDAQRARLWAGRVAGLLAGAR